MDYLEAAVFLNRLIKNTNSKLLKINSNGLTEKNQIVIRTNFGKEINIRMDSFTNEFIQKTLREFNSELFVITDLISTDSKGQELTYFLYKGYHNLFNKGLVYFQMVDKETLSPIGELKFSNLEDNIFYTVKEPDFEESLCHVIETDKNTLKEQCINYLIGNVNEERLIYDIQRLIYDSANNAQKHKNRLFKFNLQISKFGSKPSTEFTAKIDSIKNSTEIFINPEYPNSLFAFDIEQK